MPKFDFEAKLSSKETRKLELPAIEGTPWLEVARADRSNRGYINELLMRSQISARKTRGAKITAQDIENNYEYDYVLFPKHVIRDWGNVYDAKSKSVPFSREVCEEFLRKLPDWLFDEIRDFVNDASNFTVHADADPDEVGKGSQSSSSGS